jgi:NADPH-dependent glutamate synthase beta subunit-like oxidoreductase
VLDIVRGDWERAYRELEQQKRDPRRYRQLLSAVDAVTQALRTRVGQTYTLEELARAYGDVERWGRDAVEENAQYDGWARDLALVEDAAFHDYARGALDFEP